MAENIGALWEYKSKKGNAFFKGIINPGKLPSVEKVQIVALKNRFKKGPRSPDFFISIDEPRGQREAPQGDMFSTPGAGSPYGDDDEPF